MFLKDLIEILDDIAESLRMIAKRESDFPVGFKQDGEPRIEVYTSDLPNQALIEEEKRQEKVDEQIEERAKGFFFAEDVVDEELITGGFV